MAWTIPSISWRMARSSLLAGLVMGRQVRELVSSISIPLHPVFMLGDGSYDNTHQLNEVQLDTGSAVRKIASCSDSSLAFTGLMLVVSVCDLM